MKHSTVIQKEGMFGYFAWPSVARLRDRRIVAVCSGFRMSHICPFGKVAVTVSEDEGKTWSEPKILFDTPLDDRDGGITPWGDGFLLTTFNNTREFQRITNEQRPFKNAEKNDLLRARLAEITDEEEQENLGSLYAYFDKDFNEIYRGKLPITAPHGFTLLNDGTLFYVGRRFNGGTGGKNAAFETYPKEGIGYLTSKDGKEFSTVTWLKLPDKELLDGDLFCEPHAIQLKNGRIIIQIRLQNNKAHLENSKNGLFTIYQCVSDDNGKTFTVPAPLNTPEGAMCGSPPHMVELPNGEIVTVYGYREEPFGQRARVSFDNGDSFSREIVLRDDGPVGDLGYPASVLLKDGDLLTVYYQKTTRDAPCGIYATKWNYREFLK